MWKSDDNDKYLMIKKRKGRDQRPTKAEVILNDAKDFSSTTTIHGISYLTSPDHSICSSLFWILTVTLAIVGTSYQVYSIWNLWGESPVITTLETISYPIEKIQFPAVTLCPQGSVLEIMDAVLYYQFEEWVLRKLETDEGARHKRTILNDTRQSLNFWKFLTNEKLTQLLNDFLNEVYPGAKDMPTKFVALLNSDDPDKTIESTSILMPENKLPCNGNDNQELLDQLKQKMGGECPERYENWNSTTCILPVDVEMTYDDASSYCRDQKGAKILFLDSLEEMEELQQSNILGTLLFLPHMRRFRF